jgi:hypothetical protein
MNRGAGGAARRGVSRRTRARGYFLVTSRNLPVNDTCCVPVNVR